MFKTTTIKFISSDARHPRITGKIYEGRIFTKSAQAKAAGYERKDIVKIFTEKEYQGFITVDDFKHIMKKGDKHEKNNS